MDKYEYKVKLAQIEKLAAKKDFVTAARIADGIDWRKVKSVSTLSLVADVYEANDRLEDCYELLNMVYDRSPIGRGVVYRMAEIATKMHDFEEAIDLYKEFIRIAPHDLSKYILKYQIYRERGSSVADQIVILEEFKSHEYDERWSYELALLYEEAGMIDRCIEECDELILWFSEGEYVAKAMELKMKYQELTASQQEKFEHRYDYLEQEEESFDEENEETLDAVEEEPEAVDDEEKTAEEEPAAEVSLADSESEEVKEPEDDMPQVTEINPNKFSTINLQEELAKGLQEILAQAESEAEAVQEEAETVDEPAKEPVEEEKKLSDTADLKAELLKYTSEAPQPTMEEMLRTEEDGQISLAIGEENILEKQITGQMTIGEILEAWEVKKRLAKEKLEKAGEKKQAVLYETSEITSLLEDFMPRTPKDVQKVVEDAVETAEPETEIVPEELTEEPVTEEPAAEEPAEEPVAEMPVMEDIEDDLPQDIDFEAVLEAALNVAEEKEAEEDKAAEPAEKPVKKVTQDTASMLDAIERALLLEGAPTETAGKYLTEEQEKIFAYFTSVSGMKKQLAELLGESESYVGREDSTAGNLIITGHPGNGKTTLAIDIVKAFQKQRREKGGKLAKVTGDGMNKKDPQEVISKLGGGALIIERAGSLNDETVNSLSLAMEGMTGGLLIILEDDETEIAQLMGRHHGFAVKFDRTIHIPIFSNDELVAFGKSYAEEQEYYFDEMAVLALYDSIGVHQTSDHVVNITEVKEFVDEAIAHAEKKSRGFFARLSKKRIDEYGNKLLLEEDFDF